MTIAEVARKYDLSIDTLRYYERIGLIPPVKRSKGGVRDYDEIDCLAVSFIKCMRSAGIPIESLIEYMNLLSQGKETRETRKAILREQRELIAVRITEMRQTLENLDFKIANYDTIIAEAENKLSQEKM
jgi:DNA-binding transcriptional MerR regulator